MVLPIIRPALIATLLFSFSLSFDEFIRTLFVMGYERTMPVMFWSTVVDRLAPRASGDGGDHHLDFGLDVIGRALAATRAGRSAPSGGGAKQIVQP